MKVAMKLLQPGTLSEARHAVGCVIITYNSAAHIANCLDGLGKLDVVVVDNDSSDQTCDIVQRGYPHVRLIRAARNLGLAAAFNIGWRSMPNRAILLLNPDIRTDPSKICRLESLLSLHDEIAILAPRLTNFDGTPQYSVRTFPTLATAIARRTRLGRTEWGRRVLARHLEPSWPGATACHFVDWALGAALLVRRDALELLNGYDERYFLYCEDVDFCARAWRSGLAVAVTTDVAFKHEYQRQSAKTFDLRSAATRAHLASTVRLAVSYPKQYVLGFEIRPAHGAPSCEHLNGIAADDS